MTNDVFKRDSKDPIYVSNDAVWVTDIKLVRKLEKECDKKLNFFGRIVSYNRNTMEYEVEFKTSDNNFVTFWIDAEKLDSANHFSNNTIGYYMRHYDLQAILDYEEYTRHKTWYKKERAKSNGRIAPVDTTNGAKKGY